MELSTIGKSARWLTWASLGAAIANIIVFKDDYRYLVGTGVCLANCLYYAHFLRKRSRNELASWMGNVVLPNETNLDPLLPWLGAGLWLLAFVFPQYWYWTSNQ
jgi:hypothetical protein